MLFYYRGISVGVWGLELRNEKNENQEFYGLKSSRSKGVRQTGHQLLKPKLWLVHQFESSTLNMLPATFRWILTSGNTKGGSITIPLTSCLTGFVSAVWKLTILVFICKTDQSKPVKQEVNGTMILPPLSIPAHIIVGDGSGHQRRDEPHHIGEGGTQSSQGSGKVRT